MRLAQIISGGQTGVDRAALDAALHCGLGTGGWCPHGRRAEDGRIPDRYLLRESPSRAYRQRTRLNVLDSDATLVVTVGALEGGSQFTAEIAARHGRLLAVVDLDRGPIASQIATTIAKRRCRVLNVAGPRESRCPGIHRRAFEFLVEVFRSGEGGSIHCETTLPP